MSDIFTHEDSVKLSGLYGDSLITDSLTSADKPWDKIFTDARLQQLIKEGLANNLDLKIAVQKTLESEAMLGQSKDAFLPALSAFAQGSTTKNSKYLYPTGPFHVKYLEAGLTANWELDIWGKLSSAERAAYAGVLESDAGKKAVQTRLVANIAQAYYTLMALDAELTISEQSVKNYSDLVETMKMLQSSGKVTGAAVMQSEATKYAVEISIPDIKQQILEEQNVLCLLLGRTGSKIERGKIDEQPPSPLIQLGVPAMLLDNRPDVMQARYALMSAYETTDAARAYFYPALTITATGGYAASNLSNLINPLNFLSNVVGGLTQPILNKGANTARFEVAKAQQEEALLNFRNTLLSAGSEVQNVLGSYQASIQKAELREKQLESLLNSVDFTKKLLMYSQANYTEVLNAETSLLSAQINSVNDKLQQLNAGVLLYRALGGGWKN